MSENLQTIILEEKYEKFITNNLCCICFENKPTIRSNSDKEKDLSLNDIKQNLFENGIIWDDILILSCCEIHYLCIDCLRKIVNNYENHPINENNSHITCPYPFKECVNNVGYKNSFIHSDIEKIFKRKEDLINYNLHAEQFTFPGYTIIKCPMYTLDRNVCNANILVSNDDLKTKEKGEIVVQCDQNNLCLKRFCLTCKKTISYYISSCNDCILAYENENPQMFNYFLNKKQILTDTTCDSIPERTYNESEYLYRNGEITKEIAIKQILDIIEDINNYMICPICKISIYKTEQCNGISHHNIERCYVCGRIGYRIKGLGDHWSYHGIGGCYRFDTDTFVREHLINYKCVDSICKNHDLGDCMDPDHQQGIEDMNLSRKKAYIYHIFVSLLSEIRYDVYDELYEMFKKNDELMKLLPYKQTLKMLEIKKDRIKDYNEENVYNALNLEHVKNIYDDKQLYIDCYDYLSLYTKKEEITQKESFQEISNRINVLINQVTNQIDRIDSLSQLNENLGIDENTNRGVLDEDVDMSDIIIHAPPPPPIYLRKQLYNEDTESEDNYEMEQDLEYMETRQLIPSIALNNTNETQRNQNGYVLLDDILEILNEELEE